jgi:outer membrane protein assembly factor BamD (BamD/ComL family)
MGLRQTRPILHLALTGLLSLLCACAHTGDGGAPSGDSFSGDGAARLAFEAALQAQADGSTLAAQKTFEELARQQPWSWWGRRALEELDRSLASLPPDAHEAALLQLQVPGNTGQLLFYSARAQAPANPSRAVALCLLLLQTDPGSPCRSQCEDLTLALLPDDRDRTKLLEEWVVPGRRDDPASFYDGRRQAQELELARLYLTRDQPEPAQEHLLNCVNRYEGARLKDDALLLLSQAASQTGRRGLCRRSLTMLTEDYPHSRHSQEARDRLTTGYCGR